MQTTTRQLRETASTLGRLLPPFTRREYERYQEILQESPGLLAGHARHSYSFGQLACSLRTTPATLRRYVTDLDELIGAILHKHLIAIAEAFGALPAGPAPEGTPEHARQRARDRRLCYYNLTHTGFGLNYLQQLLKDNLHTLPPDLRAPLEAMRRDLGVSMAADLAQEALDFFELPWTSLNDIENLLYGLSQSRAAETAAYTLPPAAPQAAPLPAPELETEPEPEPEPLPEPEMEPDPGPDLEPHAEAEPQTGPQPELLLESSTEIDELTWCEHAPSVSDAFLEKCRVAPRGRDPPE